MLVTSVFPVQNPKEHGQGHKIFSQKLDFTVSLCPIMTLHLEFYICINVSIKEFAFFFCFFPQKIIIKVNNDRIARLLRQKLISNTNNCDSSNALQIKVYSGVTVYKSYMHSGVAVLCQGLLGQCLFSLAIISSCAIYGLLILTVLGVTHCRYYQ